MLIDTQQNYLNFRHNDIRYTVHFCLTNDAMI